LLACLFSFFLSFFWALILLLVSSPFCFTPISPIFLQPSCHHLLHTIPNHHRCTLILILQLHKRRSSSWSKEKKSFKESITDREREIRKIRREIRERDQKDPKERSERFWQRDKLERPKERSQRQRERKKSERDRLERDQEERETERHQRERESKE
jgi:hypothetical protein